MSTIVQIVPHGGVSPTPSVCDWVTAGIGQSGQWRFVVSELAASPGSCARTRGLGVPSGRERLGRLFGVDAAAVT